MGNDMEWVVQWWINAERKERRFGGNEKDRAYRYAMLLPPSAKIYVDHVNFGEEVCVR